MIAPFIAVGILYICLEAIAWPLLLALVLSAVAVPVAIIVGGLLTIIGLINYGGSFWRAFKQGDPRWMADHALAPMLGTFVPLFLYGPVLKLSGGIAGVSEGLSGGWLPDQIFGDPMLNLLAYLVLVPLGVAAALCLALGAVAVIFSAPYLAVMTMLDDNYKVRRWSYLAFVICGSYWGMLAVHFILHRPLPLD
jgi:hypothetical protein